jgi:hypothetical protein
MLLTLALIGGTKAVELSLRFHNDFMKKYRQAQAEGRL